MNHVVILHSTKLKFILLKAEYFISLYCLRTFQDSLLVLLPPCKFSLWYELSFNDDFLPRKSISHEYKQWELAQQRWLFQWHKVRFQTFYPKDCVFVYASCSEDRIYGLTNEVNCCTNYRLLQNWSRALIQPINVLAATLLVKEALL
jgi:hypothetical protein